MNESGIKIEIHLLQNFAPSNLNRDDTGQPKSAYFGGFRRARISSQCSKRSTRLLWRSRESATVGERTLLIKKELSTRLKKEGRTDEEISRAVDTFLSQFYTKMAKNDKTAVLLFVSEDEIKTALQMIEQNWDYLSSGKQLEAKIAKEVGTTLDKAKLSADIALFGRMLAEQPERNTDGACQVAHPISTHKVDMEMDFFTAVDDLNPEGETGAGMMGVVGFNSACYYRYALVDRDQLARNLARKTERKSGGWIQELESSDYQEADRVIKAFLEAMVYAIPSGKQNSFAAQNLPSFGLFVRRQGGVPVSLANAFSKPVRPTNNDEDLVGLSLEALAKHWEDLQKVYGNQGIKASACFQTGHENRLHTLKELDKGSVEKAISTIIETTGDR